MDFLNDSIEDLLKQLSDEIALTELIRDSYSEEHRQLQELNKKCDDLKALASRSM